MKISTREQMTAPAMSHVFKWIWSGMPMLLVHIFDVVALRSSKQMVRVYTGRIIAPMQNKSLGWDRPMEQNPCEAMS